MYRVIAKFRQRRTSSVPTSIYDLLYNFRTLLCTDSRDRITSFLGLAGDIASLGLNADYSLSIVKPYAVTARTFITGHKALDALNCRREPLWDDSPCQQEVTYSLRDQANTMTWTLSSLTEHASNYYHTFSLPRVTSMISWKVKPYDPHEEWQYKS
jgi:hypothetical protein